MAHDQARAFWIAAPGRGEIRDETLAAPGPADVVVRARYSGISRGTEALVFQGRVPPSEYARMRAPFQGGDFPGPVKYGYASVGRVDRGRGDLQGRDVFVLYPHQTEYVVPASAVHVLPDGVPSSRAVLAANLETAINGVWDAAPQPGSRVVVVGGGTVGCLVAWYARRAHECDVQLVDVNPQRASIARALGVHFSSPETAWSDVPVVIHASTTPEGLALALRVTAFEGTIVEMSWYGDRLVPVPLGADFHARRLTITSSQVGHVAPARRGEWDTRRRMQLALASLADPALDVLISGESNFDALPSVMAELSTSPGNTLCHRIKY